MSRRPDPGVAPGPVPVEQGSARDRPVRLRPRRSCPGARDLRAARSRAPGLGCGVGGAGGRLGARRGDVATGGPVGRAPPLRAGAGRLPARRPPEPGSRDRHGRGARPGGPRSSRRGRRAAAARRRRAALHAARAGPAPGLPRGCARLRRGGCRRRAAPGAGRERAAGPRAVPESPGGFGLELRARRPPRADLDRRRPVRAAVRAATRPGGCRRRVERRGRRPLLHPGPSRHPRRHRQRPLVRRLVSPARPRSGRAPGGCARRDPGEVQGTPGPFAVLCSRPRRALRGRDRAARAGRAAPCRDACDRQGAVLRRRWYHADDGSR